MTLAHRLRSGALLAAAIVAVVLGSATSASATIDSPPSPVAEGLAASGFWQAAFGGGGGNVTVVFGCDATATATGIQTVIDECGLYVNGAQVAYALPVIAPGPVAATAARAAFPILGVTSVNVCWKAHATFAFGTEAASTGCTNANLL